MSRLLFTLAMFSLLVGLGALAVAARPNDALPGAISEAIPQEISVAAAPELTTLAAPDATSKYNVIALPLDVQSSWAANSIPFDARGLAQYVGTASVAQVLRWDANRQSYDKWFPGGNYGFVGGAYTTVPFSLTTGDAYRLLINSTSPTLTMVSLVGNVPEADSIKFTLVGASVCKYNEISIPLEQSNLVNAGALATSMGDATNVSQVLRWDASRQSYDKWFPGGNYGFVSGVYTTTPFAVQIGYPYLVCLKAGANGVVWP